MENTITPAALSRQLEISKAAVSKLCKTRLKDCFIGKKLDLDHPVLQEYVKEKEADKEAKEGKKKAPESKPKKVNGEDLKEVRHVAFNAGIPYDQAESLTVKEVAIRFGSAAGFATYIKAMRDLSDWKNKELKHDTDRKKLIEKIPTGETLFAIVDLAFKRLVEDAPRSLVDQLKAIAKSKRQTVGVEMEEEIRKVNSRILKDCKSEIKKSLKRIDDDK